MKRVLFITILITCIGIVFVKPVSAEGSLIPGFTWDTIQGKVDSFKNGATEKNLDASQLINSIASILATIGVVVVLAGLLIVGIKYMTASPDQAAKLKASLIGLVVAGVVILGSFGIWNLVKSILEKMT